MAGKIKGITVEIGGDVTKLGSALKDVEAQAKSAGRELKGVSTIMSKYDGGGLALAAQQGDLLGQRVDALTGKLATLRQAQEQEQGRIGPRTAEQAAAYRDLEREIAATEGQLQKARVAQEEYLTGTARVSALGARWQEQGAAIAATARSLVPLSIAVGLFAKNSLDASIQFESSFAGVRKTVDATDEQLQKLSETSRQMALAKPVDVNDINHIMELGGQLGIATDKLAGFADVVSDLSVSTDLDVETASTDLAQFANITGMAQDEFSNCGATIVDLGNHSATTESQIMDMAMRIAGAGTSVGMTQDQILGVSAALASVGINAEAGGSAVSTVISNIDKAVALNSDELQTWAQTAGMSAEQFAAAWKADPVEAFSAVISGMSATVDEGGNLAVLLDDLGVNELRQTDMLKRLANAHDVLGNSLSVASNAWQENSALANEAAQRYATTESQIQLLKNRINDAAISAGDALKPVAADFLGVAADVAEGARDVAKAFGDMDPVARKVVTTVALMAAGASPLLAISGKLTSGAGKFVSAMGKVASAAIRDRVAIQAGTAALKGNQLATMASTTAKSASNAITQLAAAAQARKTAATVAGTAATAANTAATAANAAAQGRMSGALRLVSAAQEALNLAFAANPVGVVLAGAGAAVGIISTVVGAMRDAGDAVQDASDEVDTLSSSLSQVDGNVAAVQGYADTIQQLAGHVDGDSSKMAQLKVAVDGFNDATGASISIVDQQSGALDAAAGKVDELTQAYVRQAKADAYKDTLTDLFKQQAEYQKGVQDAQAQMASAGDTVDYYQEQIDALNQSFEQGSIVEGYYNSEYGNLSGAQDAAARSAADASAAYEDQKGKLDAVNGQIDSVMAALSGLEEEEQQAGDAAQDAGGDAADAAEKARGALEDIASGMDSASISSDEAARRIQDAFDAMEDGKVDTDAVTKALERAGYETDGLTDDMIEYAAQTHVTGQALVSTVKAQNEANEASEKAKKALEEHKQAVEDLNAAMADDSALSELVAATSGGAESFAGSLEAMGGSVQDFLSAYSQIAQADPWAVKEITDDTEGYSWKMRDALNQTAQYYQGYAENLATVRQAAIESGDQLQVEFVDRIAALGPESEQAAQLLYYAANEVLQNGQEGLTVSLAELAQASHDEIVAGGRAAAEAAGLAGQDIVAAAQAAVDAGEIDLSSIDLDADGIISEDEAAAWYAAGRGLGEQAGEGASEGIAETDPSGATNELIQKTSDAVAQQQDYMSAAGKVAGDTYARGMAEADVSGPLSDFASGLASSAQSAVEGASWDFSGAASSMAEAIGSALSGAADAGSASSGVVASIQSGLDSVQSSQLDASAIAAAIAESLDGADKGEEMASGVVSALSASLATTDVSSLGSAGASLAKEVADGMGSAQIDLSALIAAVASGLGSEAGVAAAQAAGQNLATSWEIGLNAQGVAGALGASEAINATVASALGSATGGAAGCGESVADAYAAGLGSEGQAEGASAAGAINAAVASALSSAVWAAGSVGGEVGSSFAGGIVSQVGMAGEAGRLLGANAVGSMDAYSGEAYVYGSHYGSNFASGILSQLGAIAAASNAAAAAAAAPLHHSVPKVGPLKGDDEWGAEYVENIAGAMRGSLGLLRDASAAAAEAMVVPIPDPSMPRAYEARLQAISYGGDPGLSGLASQVALLVRRIDDGELGGTVNNYSASLSSGGDVAEAFDTLRRAIVRGRRS